MKLRAIAWFGIAVATGLSVPPVASAGPASPVVLAQKKNAKTSKAGTTPREFHLVPRGIQWGMGLNELKQIYDKDFEQAFLPRLKAAQPGIEMRALEEELKNHKALVKRNHIEFGNLPTGVDSTPLKGEYSYNNAESMTRVTLLDGITRHFFFFDNKLWKVYDEHPFGKKSSIGSSFEDAVKVLTDKFRAPPEMVEPDYKKQMFTEARWKNDEFVVRAIDRGKDLLAMVYEDRSVSENLDRYRTKTEKDPNALDDDVSEVLRDNPQPGKGPEKK